MHIYGRQRPQSEPACHAIGQSAGAYRIPIASARPKLHAPCAADAEALRGTFRFSLCAGRAGGRGGSAAATRVGAFRRLRRRVYHALSRRYGRRHGGRIRAGFVRHAPCGGRHRLLHPAAGWPIRDQLHRGRVRAGGFLHHGLAHKFRRGPVPPGAGTPRGVRAPRCHPRQRSTLPRDPGTPPAVCRARPRRRRHVRPGDALSCRQPPLAQGLPPSGP